MNETYTFSRALHMMRYGDAKMKCITYASTSYICIIKGKLCCSYNGSIYELDDNMMGEFIGVDEIMGSWVEVK